MPTALRMQRDFGDRLHVLLVEAQGHPLQDVQELALRSKWFGSAAMWTLERPVLTGARGLPDCVLLSSDGDVVMAGNPLALHSDIEDYVDAAAHGREPPPATLPRELHGAWRTLQKGDYTGAVAAADAVGSTADGQLADAAHALAGESRVRARGEIERLGRAIDAGVCAASRARLETLLPTLEGLPCAADTQRLLDRLASDELQDEIAAEKELLRLEQVLFGKRLEASLAPAFEKLAARHAGTKAAARAQAYAELLTAAGD